MASIIQNNSISDDTDSPIRAQHSLRETQVAAIVAGLKGLGVEWSLERHESCDGHLSFMLIHSLCDMTIVVDRDAGGIRISVMHDDELQAPRHCSSTAQIIEAIETIRSHVRASDLRPIG